MDHVENITNCNCTENDYECDWGFERTVSGKCVKMPEVTLEPPSYCNGNYKLSQGYRSIPGDTCINPIAKYQPTLVNCPAMSQQGEQIPLVILIVIIIAAIVVILGLLFLGMVIGSRSEWVRRTLPWVQKAPQWINITMNMDHDESSGIDIEEDKELKQTKDEHSQHDTDFEDVLD